MTAIQKTAMIVLLLFAISFIAMSWILSNKLKTYESALDNTVDATIMEIDEHKNIIKGERIKIANKCKKIVKNLPHRFVED